MISRSQLPGGELASFRKKFCDPKLIPHRGAAVDEGELNRGGGHAGNVARRPEAAQTTAPQAELG
jgi:hypothetical protein